jgi:Flp pilus assembly protein TadG
MVSFNFRRHPAQKRHRKGAMMVLIAVCLPLCVIMAAFAIDVAWMQLVRTELRTATDAASRAAAKQLSLSQDTTTARQAAKDAALRNKVAGRGLVLADSQIEFGTSSQSNSTGRFQFQAGGNRPNSVKVTGERTSGSVAGPVDLLLAGVLGVREFEPTLSATSTQLDRDVCLVLDRSGSMSWAVSFNNNFAIPCLPPNSQSRWAALDAAVRAFLDELDQTRQQEFVAMVSYGSDLTACGINYRMVQTDSNLTENYSAVQGAMTRIGSQPIQGATAIGAGLSGGISTVTGANSRPFAKKTIILMTDGLHNTGPEPIIAAREAARQEIVVHTITFSDEADVSRMQAVAAATGGQHFHAPTRQDLVRIFREIARTLPVLTTE